jgi:hypothetical protein
VAGKKPSDIRHRSRITKGTILLPDVNQGSVWGRIMKDVLDAAIEHCGGDGEISELERLQARRIACLEAELIHTENRIGMAREAGQEPEPATVTLYCTLSNAQRRHCEALGWKRQARDVTPASARELLIRKGDVEDV